LSLRPKASEMILVASWVMGLVAAVHQWVGTGILSPTMETLEARAVATVGRVVDIDLGCPVVYEYSSLWLCWQLSKTQMS
jgi:hypothetical protein